MATVKVEYVGLKPQETDHLYGTWITWAGVGDVKDVPAETWPKMAKHPDVWRLVVEQAVQPPKDDQIGLQLPPSVKQRAGDLSAEALDGMSDDEVKAEAKHRGYELHPRLNPVNLRARFLEYQQPLKRADIV